MDLLPGHCFIHPDADVHYSVTFDHFCRVERGVKIGAGTRVRSYVELREGTVIGENCYIDSYVVSSGNCRVGNNVTLRYGAIVAQGCDLDDAVYFAPRVMTNNLDHERRAVGGAHVSKGVFVGTHAVLAAGIKILEGVTVGSGAFVSRSLTEPGVYVGIPARKRS